MLISYLGTVGFWEYTHTSYPSYQYESPEKRERYMRFLENNDVLYSYTIDHLKRHWVMPHLEKESAKKVLQEQFEVQEQNRAL